MALIAENEREMISSRTKAALAAAKDRGKQLGGWRGKVKIEQRLGVEAIQRRADTVAESVGPIIAELRQAGCSLRQIAATLAERGIRRSRGGAWSADAVRQVLLRAGGAAVPALK